jgi:hypothetical protein
MGTVPTPLDWIAADGTFITAAIGQAGVGDVLDFLLNPPAAQVRRTTAQSIPNGTPTLITFDTEDVDTDGLHTASGSKLTIATPGTYLVSASIPYDVNVTGYREARITKNTVSFVPGTRAMIAAAPTVSTVVHITALEIPLIAGDFLELSGVQTSGGALNTSAANGAFPILRASWVRP